MRSPAGDGSFPAMSTFREPTCPARVLVGPHRCHFEAPRAWQTGQMERRKWFDSIQPQTLQIAVILLYINAAFGILSAIGAGGIGLLILPIILEGLAAYGIANERRKGYIGGIILSAIFAALSVALFVDIGGFSLLLNVVFSTALFFALRPPMTRDYR